MSRTVFTKNVRCKDHPTYKGIQWPRCKCPWCVLVWISKRYPGQLKVREQLIEHLRYEVTQ